jgi:hypothetical protein
MKAENRGQHNSDDYASRLLRVLLPLLESRHIYLGKPLASKIQKDFSSVRESQCLQLSACK